MIDRHVPTVRKFALAGVAMALLVSLSTAAHATTFTNRATFEASVTIDFTEDFQSLGNNTSSLAGPALLPSGITVSSQSNSLFVVGPGQSSNPTTAIGSNSPLSDSLTVDLGGSYSAFGVDLFQNFGGGSQGGSPINYELSFFNGAVLIDTIIASVAPNGGSFSGYISGSLFDSVEIFSLATSYEILDNVTVGSGESRGVPEPGSMMLFGAGIVGLGLMRRRKRLA